MKMIRLELRALLGDRSEHPYERQRRLGLILGLTGIVSLDFMAVLVPRFADAEEGRVGLRVGQCWSGCGELRDVAVYKFHLQCAKVVRIWHLV